MRLVSSSHRTTILLILLLLLAALSCNSPALIDPSEKEGETATDSASEAGINVSFPKPEITPLPWEQADYVPPFKPEADDSPQTQDQQVAEAVAGQVIEPVSDAPSQMPEQAGSSLGNPLPAGALASSPYWDLEVIDVIRGAAAFDRILQDFSEAAPPPSGMEYVAVEIRLRNKFIDEHSHFFDLEDIVIVGDRRLSRKDFLADVPSPEIVYTDTFVGEELVGWYETLVDIGENNLILAMSLDPENEEVRTFLALEENASLPLPPELAEIQPNDLGLSPDNPAPIGETAISEDWQITVLEVLRGDEALSFLQQIDPANTGADEGMEPIVARSHFRYLGSNERVFFPRLVAYSDNGEQERLRFKGGGPYNPPFTYIVGYLPGGEFETWAVVQAQLGDEKAVLLFEPSLFADDDENRFFGIGN